MRHAAANTSLLLASFAAAVAVVATATGGLAQTRTFDLPSRNPVPRENNIPFAGAISRYQQWYSAADVTLGAKRPCRVTGIQFKTTKNGQTGSQLDLEITMAHGPAFGPGVFMDSNLAKNRTVVFPRAKVTLPTSMPGAWTLQFDFGRLQREFVWDGESPIVIDVKLFSNGRPNNQPFKYDFESTVASIGMTTRLFGFGTNPRAIQNASTIQQGWGLSTRFVVVDGVTVPHGAGCPGAGRHVPEASTTGGNPLPGNSSWTHVLTKARSQVNAVLLLGGSNQKWGSVNLPLDLKVIGASGCFLRNDIAVNIPKMTVGGGPGAGSASIPVPIPPITIFFGQSLYTQWLVWDNQSPNGVLAMSNGLRNVFG